MPDEYSNLKFDTPLRPGEAINADKLERLDYCRSVVRALKQVSSDTSLVISIEGSWGSGKTSVLAMIEDLLNTEQLAPVIVHFNPWLIGDRDALLRQFLAKIARSIKLTDKTKVALKAAKELQAYAKAFDIIKLIPGAEPLASIVKAVVTGTGEVTAAIAEQKEKDIEEQKLAVEQALRKYSRRIVVFIDDIDRLYPNEVFEIIRIIKSVGDLPNVGYVVAWDRSYVTKSLSTASVPNSTNYLEKIVQLRMPLPRLATNAKLALMDQALLAYPPEVRSGMFKNSDERLSWHYHLSLKNILEQPRDFVRVFNSLSMIEPALRGEVVFADILALATIMIKAPATFELLCEKPQYFVGRMPSDKHIPGGDDTLVKQGDQERKFAIDASSNPRAVEKLIHLLFPKTAQDDDRFGLDTPVYAKGHLGDPARLAVSLQMSLGPNDVSLAKAAKYLTHPPLRSLIARNITDENCYDFLQALGDLYSSTGGQGVTDTHELCLTIARLIDHPPYSERKRESFISLDTEHYARETISQIIHASPELKVEDVGTAIIRDPDSLTMAAQVLTDSYIRPNSREEYITCPEALKEELFDAFAKNVMRAADNCRVLKTANFGWILWTLGGSRPQECKKIFEAISRCDPNLDKFAVSMFSHSYDSVKGRSFQMPNDTARVEAFSPLDFLVEHAKSRLDDPDLNYPERAAWRCIVEEKALYGLDGSEKENF